MNKTCSICHKLLPLSDFTKNVANNQQWFGYRPECKSCRSKTSRKDRVVKCKDYWSKHDPYLEPRRDIYERRCYICKLTKHITNFFRNSSRYDGLGAMCKLCQISYNKIWTSKNKGKVNERSKAWMKKTGYNVSLRQRHRTMKSRNGGYIDFTYEQLLNWYQQQKRKCHYCQCPEAFILNGSWKLERKFKTTVSLTIDRKDNSSNYNLENICLACDNCNVLKSSFFTEKEFKEIAKQYIKPRWKALTK